MNWKKQKISINMPKFLYRKTCGEPTTRRSSALKKGMCLCLLTSSSYKVNVCVLGHVLRMYNTRVCLTALTWHPEEREKTT